jgi:glycosyltransferase involved in cell wall biosynthesis
LRLNNIDIIYYLTPFQNELNFPYIITHWDLGHKSTFAFPELVMNDSFEFRNNYHKENLNKAFKIFVESEESVRELSYFENISDKKITIIPLFPSDVVKINPINIDYNSILNKYQLSNNNFFFYPAQFWSHKNHVNLLIAFKLYLENFNKCKMVLTGADKGNYTHVVATAKDLGIFDSIIFTGFVTNEEIFTFYKNCISLVMPTFLGPTNMPLIEAYELDCKIICSNLNGHIEMLGNNALYFSPNSPTDIYNAMCNIQKNHFPIREKNLFSIEKSITKIEQSLDSLINVRNTFGIII